MADHLVFVPGLLCTDDLFRDQIAVLSGDMEVGVADTLHDDSLGAMAERLLAAAPPRFCLAGLSMGGYVAFEVLERAPERVERLVLLDTSARADLPEQSEGRRALVARARAEGIGAAVETLAPRLLAARNRSDPALLRRLHDMARTVGVEQFARQQAAIIARPDRRDRLSAHETPTLVIVGDEDALIPPDLAREIADRLPHARLEIVAGCGHLSTMEQPDAVTALMRSFLGPSAQLEAGPNV